MRGLFFRFAAAAVVFVMLLTGQVLAVLDGFNINSNTFDNQYNGNQIWDGVDFQNQWAQAGGTTPASLSLSGTNLVVNNDDVNGWVAHDDGSTPWELGAGNWTVEVSVDLNNNGPAEDGMVLWTDLGGNNQIIWIQDDGVSQDVPAADTLLVGGIDNTDGFHTFRVAFDGSDTTGGPDGTYHVWRDDVAIAGFGVGRRASTANTRLIIGDCCSSIGNPVDEFEIAYVRYDMDGAFSPVDPTGSIALVINRDTGNISFTNSTSSSVNNIIGYSILSDAGGLSQANWNQQATGSQLANDDDDWTVLTGAGVSTDLSEAVLVTNGTGNGGDLAASGGSWDFGNVWVKSPYEDIALEILLNDGSILELGTDFSLEYAGTPVTVGDITGAGGTPDGAINTLDWLEFRGNVATDVSELSLAEAYQKGDLDGDLTIGPNDYTIFVEAYDAANGAGSFAGMVDGVPEPSSVLLMFFGVGAAMYFARRNRTSCDAVRFAKGTMKMGVRLAVLLSATCLLISSAVADDFVIITYDADAGNPATADDIQSPLDQGWNEWGATQQGQEHDPLLIIQEGIIHNGVNAYRNFDDGPTNPGWVFALSDDALQAMHDFGWQYELTGVLNQGGHFSAWGVDATNPWGTGGIGRIGVAYGVGGSGGMSANPVGGGGTNVDLGAGTLGGEFVRTVMTGTPQTLDYTFELFWDSGPNAGNQIDVTQNMSGFGGSNTLNSNVLGRQSGSSGGTGREAYDHAISLTVPEPDTLTLEIGQNSGRGALVNNSGTSVSFNGYFLSSGLGTLNPNGWNSLEEQNVDGNGVPDDGIGWEEFDSSSSNFIGEGFLTGFTTLGDGESLVLGTIYSSPNGSGSGVGDLSFVLTDQLGRQIKSDLFSTVKFVDDGFEADFDGDGDVDGDDFLLWQVGFGANITSGAEKMDGDWDNDGDVDGDDFLGWQAEFPSPGEGSGSSAVPEPSTGLLGLTILGLVGLCSRRRRIGRRTAAIIAIVALSPALVDAATNDRDYQLGDDPSEMAIVDTVVGSGNAFAASFDSAGGSGGDFQDLGVIGSPTYVDVSDRPGASSGDLGASFIPASFDQLWTNISMNAPDQMWDNPDFFGDPTSFPHNYTGIFGRGIQLWAKPNSGTQGVQQDVVLDTLENGIVITENNTWGLWFDVAGGPAVDSEVAVAHGEWTHVMQLGGIRDLVGGGSATDGALLVNGVAVAARAGAYDPDASFLSVGSSQDNVDNFYHGFLDNVRLFFWGDNTGVPDGPSGQQGQDWTPLDLNVDNDWIAQRLTTLGVTDPADVNLDGSVNIDDQTVFVANWRNTYSVDGVQVGDWNSRQDGDLNYDGIINLSDAFMLHEGLLAGGGSGLNFGLLGGVPEPATSVLVMIGLAALGFCRGRRQSAEMIRTA